MERTEAFLLPATGVLKLYIVADDLIDGRAFTDVLDILISYATAHVATLTSLTRIATKMGVKSICTRVGQAGNLVDNHPETLAIIG